LVQATNYDELCIFIYLFIYFSSYNTISGDSQIIELSSLIFALKFPQLVPFFWRSDDI